MTREILLPFLDKTLFLLHVIIILFNLFGWIWKKTLRLHLIVILITAGSWFVLGIWYGWGYCFLTDWHWQIKHQLGEANLPNSFITYFFQTIHLPISDSLANAFALGGFLIAIVVSLVKNYLSFFGKDREHRE